MKPLPSLAALIATLLIGTSSVLGQVKIVTTSLPNGIVGTSYSATVNTSSGTVPFRWNVSSGSLPPGIGMRPSGDTRSALLSGTPTTAGGYAFSISVQGKGGHASTAKYTVTIAVPASGTLTANPTSLAFGSVQVGNAGNLWESLTNTAGSALTISQANVSGAAFSISGLSLPLTLNPSQSVTFNATFTPSAAGAASGTLEIVSNASNSRLDIPLSGTGTSPGTLSVSPSSLNFGNVTVGSSASLPAALVAAGAPVTVSSASTDNNQYVLSGIALPLTLSAGQSVPFTVTFTPNAVGPTTSTLSFASNAQNSLTTQSLVGTGQAPVPHSADLSWDITPGAVSYNIYRKLPSDSEYAKIGSTDSNEAYSDDSVVAGETYDYVVTEVNQQQQESGYSNVAQVTIPNS